MKLELSCLSREWEARKGERWYRISEKTAESCSASCFHFRWNGCRGEVVHYAELRHKLKNLV
jgi:hypothetical protein